MNANACNSTSIEPDVSCFFAKVIQSIDLQGEALHTNGQGGESSRADLRNTGIQLVYTVDGL